MGKPSGFLDCSRQDVPRRPVAERVADFFEIDVPLPPDALANQAARCMDCGIPFCHGVGCPLANNIPEFNDLVFRGRWEDACKLLHATNNFPEITGRICPAPCEAACTLKMDDQPVLIRHVEMQIAERGFAEGWIKPLLPPQRSGKRVAVVGSGPAGLAAAQQLARAGHEVVVLEKDPQVGGLLRYGIPDFKLDKSILDRRLDQMRAEGVSFETDVVIGEDLSVRYLRKHFDAICLALGAGRPRELSVPGRALENVHFAMEYLTQQNRLSAGEPLPNGEERISAAGKIVVVIGGGDTGSDCVGTAVRQGAKQVHQFEILPKPPERVNPETPWPTWPNVLRTSSSHEEGCRKRWCVMTKHLTGAGVRVAELRGVEVQWEKRGDKWKMSEVSDTEFSMKVDLVLLAMGFVHVAHSPLIKTLDLEMDGKGNVATRDCMTSVPGIFAAGDAVSGASLIVRAIQSGRTVAAAIDRWLQQEPPPGGQSLS